jgi:hypothetical protein
VKKEQGEAYRHLLQRRVGELGLGDHVIFHNRFVNLAELCEFIGAADIYVTPYLNQEQIVSGTLAYALGAGKATVSTPYWYAEEMLDQGRGKIVPFGDAKALASEINSLLRHEVERHAIRKRAYTFCREMVWKEVARKYLALFAEVIQERENRPRAVSLVKEFAGIHVELSHPKLDHLFCLTDDVGILQHAKYTVPNRFHGYCTDDNARALIAVLMAQTTLTSEQALSDLAGTYVSFLHHAFNENTGRFRNFLGYDRRWQEEVGSPDSHGRAIWGLGEAVALSYSKAIMGAALHVFHQGLPALSSFESPRSWAFGLLGIRAYLRRFGGDSEVRRIGKELANKLFALFQKNASSDWPWIEDTVTYANGKISQALLISGQLLRREDMLLAGLRSLEWLVDIQTEATGHFVPIGNKGWYRRGGTRARFDQQPIEAQDMIEACREAYEVTGDDKWISYARLCWEWFLGRNDLGVPLYDFQTGGCSDGLTAIGPNGNQGAESTLAWLLSLLNFRQIRGARVPAEAVLRAPELEGVVAYVQ